MIAPPRFLVEGRALRNLLTAGLLGATGFALNMLDLQLGWGMHFVFGNVLILAFLRLLPASVVVGAASLASLRTVLLWNHPWAWLVWTLEAAALAIFSEKRSPVQVDVIFWLVAGTPLLVLTYGGLMHMDPLSFWLVVTKQATNGVLNVAAAEVIYAAMLVLFPIDRTASWPRVPIESMVMMILTTVILVPTTVYLAIDAPSRERAARQTVGDAITHDLHYADASLGAWLEARSLMLASLGHEQLTHHSAHAVHLPLRLATDFSRVIAFDMHGAALWDSDATAAPFRATPGLLAGARRPADEAPVLVELPAATPAGHGELALLVRYGAPDGDGMIIALLRQPRLKEVIRQKQDSGADGLTLTGPSSQPLVLHADSPFIAQQLLGLSADLRAEALLRPMLVSAKGYGRAVMSDLQGALMVRSEAVAALPGWQLAAAGRLDDEELRARRGQARLFFALTGFGLAVIVFGSLLSQRFEAMLRHIARSAADLAILGAEPETIDNLLVSEVHDISLNIATAGLKVALERGAMASYQRRLHSIARHAPVIVYAAERNSAGLYKLVYVSDGVASLLGYSVAEALQPGWWQEGIHPDDKERALAVGHDLEGGANVQLEYRFRHKQGHYVWLYASHTLESDPQFGRAEVVGVAFDVSERKRSAEQLLQADKMASLGRLIAGIGHELNQPLNFIKLATQNLSLRLRRPPIDADWAGAKLDSIIAHVERASAILQQMRIFGRKPSEAPHPMQVKQAVDAVMTMVAAQFNAANVRIDATACDPQVRVMALPVLVEQVLLNLMINASDAIRARRAQGGEPGGLIRVEVRRRGKRALIVVEDNGTGIPEADIASIFEPFFTTKPPQEGTGLGLSISYGIVRDLGGSCHAANTGRGARFTIDLPLAA
jgi:PAS domain S-box-containing protein